MRILSTSEYSKRHVPKYCFSRHVMYLIDAFFECHVSKKWIFHLCGVSKFCCSVFHVPKIVYLLHVVHCIKISPFCVSDASYFALSSQTIPVCYFLLFVFHDICSHLHIHQA